MQYLSKTARGPGACCAVPWVRSIAATNNPADKSVENFKSYEETKECVLKPLTEEEKKLVDEPSVVEIQYFTGGSPYEVNLVSHYMYKRWKQARAPKMALSVDVLDDVLEELERLRKAEHHAIANKIKTYWPETIRVLTSVLEFPNAPKEWLVRYNLISQIASSSLKDLPSKQVVNRRYN